MRVEYPIATDNDCAIGRALKNEYCPGRYVVDAQGHIRHHHFGEGEYERSARIIQQLLANAAIRGIGRELVSVDARGAEAAADWGSLKSPENYVGYQHTGNLHRPAVPYRTSVKSMLPRAVKTQPVGAVGDWTVQKQVTVQNQANGRIAYRFHARDLHRVMGPAAPGTSVRFRVLVDGKSSPKLSSKSTAIDRR